MSNLFTISKSSNSSSSLSSSSSCISSGKEELESLFQELVPTEKKSIISYLKNNRIDLPSLSSITTGLESLYKVTSLSFSSILFFHHSE